ncbi:MAG: hypothetical protein JXQ83_08100, partial [Candidatus Glassbacteria bacterium]|nr:hypothetical protein [Candidatus Glassbacteria bacterium]
MLKHYLRTTLAAGLCTAFILYPAGCRSKKEEPSFKIRTDSGLQGWEIPGIQAPAEGTYQDRGQTRKCIIIDAGSGPVKLTSPQVPTAGGRTLAFTFAVKFESAAGPLLEARLKLRGQSGNLLEDSLLYRVSSGGRRGLTSDWISYTRVLKIPEGVKSAAVEVASEPSSGRVWLGETALVEGEGWLSYAASFSTHLGRSPEDKYLYTAGRFVEPQPDPSPTAAETEAGLLFFERKGLVGAWPYASPRPADRVEIMAEKVPASAVAPFAFGVKALENVSSVEVRLDSPLAGKNGELATVPRIYQARYAAYRLGSSWGREFGVRARMLTPVELSPLPRGEVRFFWLDVPVPPGAGPDKYLGRLSIRAAGRPPLEVPFRIEVPPVSLPPLSDE